jgi:capsular polysaccharide biosynthesis protein
MKMRFLLKRLSKALANRIAGGLNGILTPLELALVRVRKRDAKEFESENNLHFTTLQTGQRVHYDLPALAESLRNVVEFREFLDPFRILPTRMFSGRNGEVRGDRGTGITAEGVVIPDNFPCRSFSQQDLRSIKGSRFLRPLEARCICSLLDPYSHNYFHWFLDVLPRLRELERYELISGIRADLLVPGWMMPWQESSLRLLAPDRNWIRHSPRRGLFRLKADQLLIPSSSRFNAEPGSPFGAMDPAICVWLRERFLDAGGIARDKKDLRLFISRKQASSRRVLNEAELFETLEPLQFQSVCLEDVPFEEQMRFFARASHVIAVHGSGLTNLLFSTGAKVLELFAEGHGVRADYLQICLALGHDYHHLVCDSSPPDNDFSVPIKRISDLVSAPSYSSQ